MQAAFCDEQAVNDLGIDTGIDQFYLFWCDVGAGIEIGGGIQNA